MHKLSILLLPLLLAGCVQAGGSPSPSATQAPHYNVATGANDLVLRVDVGGGLVPISYTLTHMPQFSLYGDGRIIVQGPMIEIYPQPLLPNLRIKRVTPSEIQTIVAAADKAGLLGADGSYTATGIFDASTTFFTVTVAGVTHRISVYALMAGVEAKSEADAAARAKLLVFAEKIWDLDGFLGRQVTDAEAFEPAGMRIFVRKASGDDLVEPAPNKIAWPLAGDPSAIGQDSTVPGTRCVLATGQDLAAFMAASKEATTITIWTHDTFEYSVMIRPLLPDETTCDSYKQD